VPPCRGIGTLAFHLPAVRTVPTDRTVRQIRAGVVARLMAPSGLPIRLPRVAGVQASQTPTPTSSLNPRPTRRLDAGTDRAAPVDPGCSG
jgi:hypothetical protein